MIGRLGAGMALLLLSACAAPRRPVLKPSPPKPSGTQRPVSPVPAKPKPVSPRPPLDLGFSPAAPAVPNAAEVFGDGPVILASSRDLGSFSLLANGGFNANWYVGYNTCWVYRLPPIPAGTYQKVYVGAKLGAMKTEPRPGGPSWERRVVPGEISIGVSDAPSWPQSRRYFLARTEDIPLEGDASNALDGVGESRWFWTELPLKAVSATSDNYVALYSPDGDLRDAAHAPILAAGPSTGGVDLWLNNNAQGRPPLTAGEALKTPVGSYEPAVAIKLVPPREARPTVDWRVPPAGRPEVDPRWVVDARVTGEDVECAWVEISTDSRSWRPWGRPKYGAPYTFTLTRDSLPGGLVRVRVTAKDIWENTGTGPEATVRVPKK